MLNLESPQPECYISATDEFAISSINSSHKDKEFCSLHGSEMYQGRYNRNYGTDSLVRHCNVPILLCPKMELM
jgi:hypothetical protein